MNVFTTEQPKFVCKLHGEQEAVLNVTLFDKTDYADILLTRPIKLERNYCYECLIDALDRSGIENLKRKGNVDVP